MNQVIGKRNGRVRDGELRNGWESKRIGDILQLEYGKPLPKSERHPDGLYPVYGANGEKSRSNRFYFDRSTIIVGRKGSAGEVTLTESKFWPLDVTYFVTFDDSKFDLAFLYHLLSTLELPRLAKGVKPGINRNDIYSLQANVPPLPEQRRIVAILDEAFAGIAAARANAERNLRNARAVFESHLEGVFSRRGEGWVERRLGEWVDDISTGPFGSLLHKSDYTEGGIPLVNPINIKESQIIPDSRKGVNHDIARRLAKYALSPNDIVIGRRGEIGRCAVVADHQSGWLCGTGCFIIKPSEETNPFFLTHLLRSESYRKCLERVAGRATMPSLSNKDLIRLKVWIPNIVQQRQILIQLDALREQTQNLQTLYQRKLAALDELKKSLLDRAFSGRL